MTKDTGSASPPTICPICERVCGTDAEALRWRPFCSQRCQQVDLIRWMDGRYTIVEDLDHDFGEDANSKDAL